MSSPDRTLISRYECKYFVPTDALVGIRMMSRPFVRPDHYAKTRPGYRYPLSSLYLDSPGLELYQTTVEGQRNRYKLRVRSYSDAPDGKIFFEVKRRSDQVVLKTRAVASRKAANQLLAGEPITEPVSADLRRFQILMREVAAVPVLRVRYEREAYESIGNDPVRITFDTKVMHAVTRTPDLSVGGPGWNDTPMEGVIVEIKFSDSCPSWVSSMIDRLEMVRESIPKYVTSLDEVLRKTAHLPMLSPFQRLNHMAAPSSKVPVNLAEGVQRG